MKSINKKMKEKLYDIIFEADTPAGKFFDIILIIIILCNSFLVIIESVATIRFNYGTWINFFSWLFAIIFTIEYCLRLWVAKSKVNYIFSFFGVIDLLAILPIFVGVFLPQIRFLVVVRIFRLLRLFSILKMGRYMDESSHLIRALRASRAKITVFLFTIFFIIVMVGSMMYIVEGPENGFDSIPVAMYWAIVTVSTVGYGDISPQTPLGKFMSSMLMIIGYGILAVPTGIISHELAHTSKTKIEKKKCTNCFTEAYAIEDRFCAKCGTSYGEDIS